MTPGRIVAFVVVVATMLLACQLIVGVRDEDGVRPPPPDPCQKRKPPLPPSAEAVAEAGPPRISPNAGPSFYAVQTFKIRPTGAPPFGYDLDDHCTGEVTSTTRKEACVLDGGIDASDDDGGLDNAFGRSLDYLSNAGNDLAGGGFSQSAGRGIFTLVLQVADYNGLADDDDVKVAIITAINLVSVGCSDAGFSASPLWDGCDQWNFVTSTPYVDPIGSTETIRGYVRSHVLVASDVQEPRSFGLGGIDITLHHPILTATIATGDGGVPMLSGGVLTGRVPAANLVGFAQRLEIERKPACDQPKYAPLVADVISGICRSRDLRTDHNDNGDLPCDALSFAIGFEAVKAGLVGPRDPPPPVCVGVDASCPP
jgi:hypothetical protein